MKCLFPILILLMPIGCTAQPPPTVFSDEMILIPEGIVQMGSTKGEPDEKPVKQIKVSTFRMQRTEVTNQQFAEFVKVTEYVTTAEQMGWGWVWQKKWRKVTGATWKHPHGLQTNILQLKNHPVVQVSWLDAVAYCQWHGRRLPTDVEWEYAAKGTETLRYPWGNIKPRAHSIQRANFGSNRCCSPDAQDGYLFTAPVGSYPQGRSPFGLDDMSGNVWEWV